MKTKLTSIIGLIYLAICIVFLVVSFRYHILSIVNSIFPPSKAEGINLSHQQKAEDFEQFYDTICSSMPMIDKYKELYGFSIKDKKEYYLSLINQTKNDFEFYCVMDAILEDIPSFHTDLVYPSSIKSLHCYNSQKISSNRDVLSANRYWKSLISEYSTEEKYYVFSYIDGKYIYNTQESTLQECNDIFLLVAIDGTDVNQYILDNVSTFNLYYDGTHNKPCRPRIVFNDSNGTKVNITLNNLKGETETKTVYLSIYSEVIFSESLNSNNSKKDYTITEAEDVAYVQVNNMSNSHGDELKDSLLNIKSQNIILDLRNNYGGNPEYAAKHIYPALFSDDMETSSKWYIPKSNYNDSIYNNLMNKIILSPQKCEDAPFCSESQEMLSCVAKQNYKGKAKSDKKVFILTSHKTGSAADRFVSDVKDKTSVTTVGNNTGGEGLMYSYNSTFLKNSHLVFIYMPGGALNGDGTDNSVYGTSPHHYVSETLDDFIKKNDLISSEKDTNEYFSKLQYDTVLKYAIEYCKKQNN